MALAFAAFAQAPAASAQTVADWRGCSGVEPEAAIAACSVIIRAGGTSRAHLSAAYFNRSNARRHRALAGSAMQTDARATAQDSARALADISRAIALNPGFAAAYINRAIISYQRGNFNRAVIDATRAISLRPDLAEAWNNRALAWHRLGQYDKAKLDFDQTIRLNKNYGNALIVREMASVSPGTLLWDLYKIPPQ